MIPKIIHQIWVGPEPLLKEYVPLIEKLKTIHPGWEHLLWTEENLPDQTIRSEWRNRLRMPAERSDLLRYELLYLYGGIYLDVDFEFLKPMNPILEMAPIVVADIKEGRVNNAFIASVPHHPIIRSMIEESEPREVFGLDKAASGSHFVDRILGPHKGSSDVKILPVASFYSTTPTEESFATHLWGRSWKDERGWKKAAVRAEKRLLDAEKRAVLAEKRFHEASERVHKLMRIRDLAQGTEKSEAYTAKSAPNNVVGEAMKAKEKKDNGDATTIDKKVHSLARGDFDSAVYWENRYSKPTFPG